MQAVDLKATEMMSGSSHRGSGMGIQRFPFTSDGLGHEIRIAVTVLEAKRWSPPHRHNFDQIRYILDGESQYGAFDMQPGDCGYFPESVEYGPQDQRETARTLVLQFPGDSAAPFLSLSEMRDVIAKLKESDPTFGTDGKGLDKATGQRRDSYELMWEENLQRPIDYAPPRYTSPVIMRTGNFAWEKDGQGRMVRHLGSFGDCDLILNMVQPAAAGVLGMAPSDRSQFWFLLQGSVDYYGAHYEPDSGFFFGPGEPPAEVAMQDAKFLVVHLPKRRSAD